MNFFSHCKVYEIEIIIHAQWQSHVTDMFRNKTVLIVGAGASREFGYPLGPDLLSNFSKRLEQGLAKYRQEGGLFGQTNGDQLLLNRYRLLFQSVGPKSQFPLDFDGAALESFQRSINQQTITSIDRFLRDHNEHAKVGKFLIAMEIIACSYSAKDAYEELHLADFTTGASIGWIATLINELREGASNGEYLKRNRLTVISFNYDKTLERALDAHFSKTSRHQGAKWRDCIQLIHVYGEIVDLQDRLAWSNFFPQIIESAKSISYIHESNDEKKFVDRVNLCRQSIIEAEKICSVGFAFDEANVTLLGLNQNRSGLKVAALNFDGNIGLNNRLARLGVSEIFQPRTGEDSMSIKKAMDYGLIP